jgi:hypothetical protein
VTDQDRNFYGVSLPPQTLNDVIKRDIYTAFFFEGLDDCDTLKLWGLFQALRKVTRVTAQLYEAMRESLDMPDVNQDVIKAMQKCNRHNSQVGRYMFSTCYQDKPGDSD